MISENLKKYNNTYWYEELNKNHVAVYRIICNEKRIGIDFWEVQPLRVTIYSDDTNEWENPEWILEFTSERDEDVKQLSLQEFNELIYKINQLHYAYTQVIENNKEFLKWITEKNMKN